MKLKIILVSLLILLLISEIATEVASNSVVKNHLQGSIPANSGKTTTKSKEYIEKKFKK